LIENLRQEIQIMKHIKHPNVVKLVEVLSSHSKIYLVLELVTGGELLNKLKESGSLREEEARFYFQQIISAVSFCEKQHIAHRDLKLENVLLDSDGRVKISDFGLSGLFKFDSTSLSLMHTTCGTVNYLAPEVFGNQGYDGHLADIWSCGVILYALLTGRLPFEDDSISRLIEKIVSGKFDQIPNISPTCADLMEKILVTDPRTRINIGNIKKHPWFSMNYEEPIGEFTDIQSPLLEKGLINDDTPRVMNAFELVNYSAGMIINKLFDTESPNFSSHFLSKEQPETIMSRVSLAMTSINCRERSQETRFCTTYESKTAPILSLRCEVLELLPELYIVTFSRILGQLNQYRRVVNNLLGNLEDLSFDDTSE
jgi:serine/threonine protein kinase